MSSILSMTACPKWRVPVAFGGGRAIENFSE